MAYVIDVGRAIRSNATLEYRNLGEQEQVLVLPPEYRNSVVISALAKKDLFIGRDGSIVTSGDLVYDLKQKKVLRLDYCHGSHILRFRGCVVSIAPIFRTDLEDYDCFAHDVLLLSGTGNPFLNCAVDPLQSVSHQYRVGPIAKRLAKVLKLFRAKMRLRRTLSLPEPPLQGWNSRLGSILTSHIRSEQSSASIVCRTPAASLADQSTAAPASTASPADHHEEVDAASVYIIMRRSTAFSADHHEEGQHLADQRTAASASTASPADHHEEVDAASVGSGSRKRARRSISCGRQRCFLCKRRRGKTNAFRGATTRNMV